MVHAVGRNVPAEVEERGEPPKSRACNPGILGVHDIQGKTEEWELGDKAKDVQETLEPVFERDSGMVPRKQASENQGAIAKPGEKANVSLRVLWCEFQ